MEHALNPSTQKTMGDGGRQISVSWEFKASHQSSEFQGSQGYIEKPSLKIKKKKKKGEVKIDF